MEAPKCRSCGKKHWLRELCVVPLTVRHVQPCEIFPGAVETTLKLEIPKPKKPAKKAPFDRNKYQREYMRKKRAKDKVK